MTPDPIPQIPLSWVGFDELPILFTNQLMVQSTSPHEVVLIFGQVTNPPTAGTEAQQRAQLEEISFVPIRPLVRLALTHDRLREYVALLQTQLERHDQLLQQMDPRQGGGTQ